MDPASASHWKRPVVRLPDRLVFPTKFLWCLCGPFSGPGFLLHLAPVTGDCAAFAYHPWFLPLSAFGDVFPESALGRLWVRLVCRFDRVQRQAASDCHRSDAGYFGRLHAAGMGLFHALGGWSHPRRMHHRRGPRRVVPVPFDRPARLVRPAGPMGCETRDWL